MSESIADIPQTVLIVDDDPRMRAYIRDLLGAESGFRILGEARDGEEAIRLVQQLRPEVVLMDLGMPRLNGYEAARRIRAEPWGGGPVLVALTGWGADEDRRRTRDAGFDRHLVKPVDPTALMKLLAELQVAKG